MFSQHPMTGDNEWDRVSGQGLSYSPGCLWVMYHPGKFAVGQGSTCLDIPAGNQDLLRKSAQALKVNPDITEILGLALQMSPDSLCYLGYGSRRRIGFPATCTPGNPLLSHLFRRLRQLQEEYSRAGML